MEKENEIVEQTTETENTGTAPAEEKEVKIQQEEKTKEKLFTQEKMNKISKDRAYRKEQEIREEYEKKLARLKNTLNAGLGTNNLEEATVKLEEYYKENGIKIPELPRYTKREEDLLANAEANDIIDHGYDEIEDKLNRLSDKGDNMTEREKKIFAKLRQEKKKQEELKELKSIGIGENILQDKEFKDFVNKLNPELPIKEKYEMYRKLNKKNIEKIGSMKNTDSAEEKYRDNYTVEEAQKFTKKELDDDPKLYKALLKSMSKWKK